MLYASHYFWTAIELRVLIPDPARGEGFWFVNVNQSRSDGLNGFKGSVIRGQGARRSREGHAGRARSPSAVRLRASRLKHQLGTELNLT
jgi:hypothetical protein